MKQFKKGDIIHSSYGEFPGTLLLVKKWKGEGRDVSYLFRVFPDGSISINGTLGCGIPRTDREATIQEKQKLLSSLFKKAEKHPYLLQEYYSLNLQKVLEE